MSRERPHSGPSPVDGTHKRRLECAYQARFDVKGAMTRKSSRRTFLKESTFLGGACFAGSPKFPVSSKPSVVVVGAGALGGWSALQLAQRGAKVTSPLSDCPALFEGRGSRFSQTSLCRVRSRPSLSSASPSFDSVIACCIRFVSAYTLLRREGLTRAAVAMQQGENNSDSQ